MRLLALAVVVLGGSVASAGPPAGGSGKPAAGLTVSAKLPTQKFAAADRPMLHVELTNTGKQAFDVVSHIATHETHYDPFTIQLYWPSPSREGCNARYTGKKQRTITLVDSRDKSAPVTVTLAPGKALAHDIDLIDWAARAVNGAKPLGPGSYLVRVEYTHQVGKTKTVARSQLLGFTITGTVTAKDMCAKNPGWQWFGPPR